MDFKVGYNPERINPGDKEHTFTRIKKIVSGQDAKTLEILSRVYESVVTAGVVSILWESLQKPDISKLA